jgi:hypothetical protein
LSYSFARVKGNSAPHLYGFNPPKVKIWSRFLIPNKYHKF